MDKNYAFGAADKQWKAASTARRGRMSACRCSRSGL
jgi:hypothetical protein